LVAAGLGAARTGAVTADTGLAVTALGWHTAFSAGVGRVAESQARAGAETQHAGLGGKAVRIDATAGVWDTRAFAIAGSYCAFADSAVANAGGGAIGVHAASAGPGLAEAVAGPLSGWTGAFIVVATDPPARALRAVTAP